MVNTSRCSSSGCHVAETGAPANDSEGPVIVEVGCQPASCAFHTLLMAPWVFSAKTSRCSSSGCHTAEGVLPACAKLGLLTGNAGCHPASWALQTSFNAPDRPRIPRGAHPAVARPLTAEPRVRQSWAQ